MRTCLILTAVFLFCSPIFASGPLVIHEWGTFTSLQNENGEAIGRINVDDEPVPAFVHAMDASVIQNSPSSAEENAFMRSKGLPPLDPDVTMRLETPVMYFHLPKDAPRPLKVDVSVEFHGGYLTQFYPKADSGNVTLLRSGSYVKIAPDTVHELNWKDLQIGGVGVGPKTDDHVWTTPREVQANSVATADGESEKFLFYRGVGHLESPLRALQTRTSNPDNASMLLQASQAGTSLAADTVISRLWLVDIAADGTAAMRALRPVYPVRALFEHGGGENLSFKLDDYSADNVKKLRKSMHAALIENGLFDDEATAMLKTWELSYFKSPGLRLFYIVPPAWTDKILPLKVSVPAEITRVMVGRIELISPEQQQLLSTIDNYSQIPKLGRFAGALLLYQQQLTPSPRLTMLTGIANPTRQ